MPTKKTAADDAATDAAGPAVVPAAPAVVTFKDTAYASRSLFLETGGELREFKVVAHRVAADAADAEALAFLVGHADLQRLDD